MDLFKIYLIQLVYRLLRKCLVTAYLCSYTDGPILR
jgi:hypothetical protein